MATTASISASQSALMQLKVQQAERAAQLAEQQARVLQLQAQSARSEASRAQQEARALEAQSNQAGVNASNARQRAEARKLDAQLGVTLEQGLRSSVSFSVVTLSGQMTGRLIDTIA
ncbi:MAG: hypothetical protein N2Z69_05430 [Methylophilaceae bacterium]|nr:hypothetical protein [Methylophilaceae bacterium]